MKRAVSLITETAAWLTSLSGALAQKYKCTKTKIQLHKDKKLLHNNKNTTTQKQKRTLVIPETQPREHQH